ncbi:MAG: hypothetical protein ACWGQW_15595 [bacterium]
MISEERYRYLRHLALRLKRERDSLRDTVKNLRIENKKLRKELKEFEKHHKELKKYFHWA